MTQIIRIYYFIKGFYRFIDHSYFCAKTNRKIVRRFAAKKIKNLRNSQQGLFSFMNKLLVVFFNKKKTC